MVGSALMASTENVSESNEEAHDPFLDFRCSMLRGLSAPVLLTSCDASCDSRVGHRTSDCVARCLPPV
jgi:hypothetical protein